MDLGSEFSALEYVKDNEVIVTDKISDNVVDIGNQVESNGSCSVVHDKQLDGSVNGGSVEATMEPVNSSPAVVGGSPASVSSSPGTVTKGYGLRKWRRIRRDVTKDGIGNVDSSKLLKRGLPYAVVPLGNPLQFSAEMNQKSEGSVSSTNAIERGLGIVGDAFPMGGNSGLPVFAAGTESKNSEGQSSKSSTAASVPKMRYEGPVSVGHAHDKFKIRSVSGKNLNSSAQRAQQGKVREETVKKSRGDRVKIEKENSYSSMESDSRSSNFPFMQGTNSVSSNGRHNGRSLNYDGNNSDGAHVIERKVSEEIRGIYGRKNGVLNDVSAADLASGLSWGGEEETSENHECSTDQDSRAEPIHMLQSVQEALEREVQKFRELGEEDFPVDDSSLDDLPSELLSAGLGVPDLSSSEPLPHFLHDLESEVTSLKGTVLFLESQLDEVTEGLKVKEAKVVELEAILNSRSLKEGTESGIELHLANLRDTESELETLFRQKIEAEVEYIAISRTIQDLSVLSVDQISLLEEQKKLASKQSQMFNKLKYIESKDLKLKRQAQVLEKHTEDIGSVDETLKLHNSVYKYSSCFLIQLIMLAIMLRLFILQFSPRSAGVVPT